MADPAAGNSQSAKLKLHKVFHLVLTVATDYSKGNAAAVESDGAGTEIPNGAKFKEGKAVHSTSIGGGKYKLKIRLKVTAERTGMRAAAADPGSGNLSITLTTDLGVATTIDPALVEFVDDGE